MDKIAVLIPCYNEEKTVEKVVRDFREVLPEAVIYVAGDCRSKTVRQLTTAVADGASAALAACRYIQMR